MVKTRLTKWRFLRMMVWLLGMLATTHVTSIYWPQRAMFVPCFFICILVPAVLLPLDKTAGTKQKV